MEPAQHPKPATKPHDPWIAFFLQLFALQDELAGLPDKAGRDLTNDLPK